MAKKTKPSSYVELANHINKLYSMPGSFEEDATMVKYFKLMMTPEQAWLASQVGRYPENAEKIAERIGESDPAALDQKLLDIALKGLMYVEQAGRGEKKKNYYHIPNWAPGYVEYMVGNMDVPGVAELFEEYSLSSGNETKLMSPNSGGMRVVPVMDEIAAQPRALDYEQVLRYLDQTFYDPEDVNHEHPLPPLFSVADCACRTSKKMIGQGCEHPIKDMCIQIGPEAEYYIRTGMGREATREEVLDILDKAEKTGCVHEVFEFAFSDRPVGESVFICNCCGCSCGVLSGVSHFGGNGATRSNYKPHVDPEKCVACGACVEKCPMDAIRLGDRLCTKAEDQVAIYEDFENYKWNKDNWNEDWRYRHVTAEFGTSPCKTYCPAHIAVQGYIRKASEGDYKGALEVIKRENPFPAVCGRVCPHPCETECSRSTVDEAVAIDGIKRFIAEKELEAEHRYIPEVKEHFENKIAIIGAGPAGLTCAYYLAARGYKPTVFEKGEKLGGMMMHGIPSFRLEKHLVEAEIDIIKEMGVEFRTGVEVGKDVTIPELREQGYEAFYVAVGLQNGGSLGIPGDDAEGVMSGITYSVKSNLEGEQKLSGKCVIIGGGNIGADVARSAVRSGASEVHLFCLEGYDEMPMGYGDRTECEQEGIVIHAGWGQTEIIKDGNKCAGIRFHKCKSVRDASGRFAPVFDDGETFEQDCSTVLYCIGQKVEWGKLLEGTKVEFNRNGTAVADPLTYQTAEPDIFVGGDAYSGQKFVIDAIAAGKQGCESIWRYVQGLNLTYFRQREYHEIDKELLKKHQFETIPRQMAPDIDHIAAKASFSDMSQTLTEEQIEKEVSRCLGCGRAIVDLKKCIGCGVCTAQCEFDAIHLQWDTEHKPPVGMKGWMGALAKHVVGRTARVAVHEVGKKFGVDPVSKQRKAREESLRER